MVESTENAKMVSIFSEKNSCSNEVAKICLEASGYNMDIASSIYANSYTSPPSKPYKNPLFYCGKFVSEWDNSYERNFTNGQCGPTNGPNCSECRKKYNPNLPTKNEDGRKVWQGQSGRFYCGVFFGKQYSLHDGICGPNDGKACGSCRRLLL